MHCYCLGEFKRIQLGVNDIKFEITDEEGNVDRTEYYCKDWLRLYLTSNSFIYIVPCVIIMLNAIIKAILRSTSLYLIF